MVRNMPGIKFDFNNMLSFNVTARHGATEKDLLKMAGEIKEAQAHLKRLIEVPQSRAELGLEWTRLPFQDDATVNRIQGLGGEISQRYRNVIFLGIGGSYLGLKAAQDALGTAYHNEFGAAAGKKTRVYFEGNNLDPDTIGILLKNLNPAETCVVVISKSGETTETRAALETAESWLLKAVGRKYGLQILVITDPDSGALRKRVIEEQKKDVLSFRSLPLLKGVGGRYSELNMGLLHLAVMGIKIDAVLSGARAMSERCACGSLGQNPAAMYAVLQTILYRKKGKSIAVLMPFSETLRSTADWYAQLLAESLGKKYTRKIKVSDDGSERWLPDRRRIRNLGRTPVAARGTNDLHSIHQNNVEGENNKTVTFIRVENFKIDLRIPRAGGNFLSGRSHSELMRLAQEATAWSLTQEKRPNCTITLPAVTPSAWGGLVYFFEMATALEGELLNVNAFDQPGVEGYKNYMYYKLGKPGTAESIGRDIRIHPLVKRKAFII